MVLHKYNKVRAKRPAKNLFFIHYSLFFSLALTALSACQSDWRNGITRAEQPAGIGFTGSVVSSQKATRADGTLINLGEYTLPASTEQQYYRYDETSGEVKLLTRTNYVGLFGCYTQQYKWMDLVDAYNTAFNTFKGSSDRTQADFLKSQNFSNFASSDEGKAYSANLFYNQRMDIAAATGGKNGTNALSYYPLKFWPNNKNETTDEHDYVTFWGYYPYNESGAYGAYGISITTDSIGKGMGLGRVRFTMHPDAAEQNDFLISEVVMDCNRNAYPLQPVVTEGQPNTYTPKPVPLRFHHMLAQVRIYAYIVGTDKMVYQKDGSGNEIVADADWLSSLEAGTSEITDQWGNTYQIVTTVVNEVKSHAITDVTRGNVSVTVEDFLALGLKVPDEEQCVRWERYDGEEAIWSLKGNRRRAKIHYKMELNNIKTSCTFSPSYVNGYATISFTEAEQLGSTSISHYVLNPYWFTFENNQRVRLNDNYMYGFFEDTPAYKQLDATTKMDNYIDIDGVNWESMDRDRLKYIIDGSDAEKEIRRDPNSTDKHYNFAPGNIILVVPQELEDKDVPNIVITATGKDTKGNTVSGKVTINMLKMGLKWESGFIYCYAFLDELCPGDDKVKGPESITTIFDPTKWTDQW